MGKHTVWSNTEPKIGSQIRVERNKYYHHGIFVSVDEVIEFGSEVVFTLEETRDITIGTTTLKEFLKGGYLEVREYSLKERITKNSSNKVIEIARSKIGEKGYDFLKNNCEHFSNYCVFNRKFSEQIEVLKTQLLVRK